jgi:hypothetical protein
VRSLRAPWCTRSSINDTGGLLTSRRSSLATSRRRNDGNGEDSAATLARVCGQRTGRRGRLGWGNSRGGGGLNSPERILGVCATHGGSCTGRTRQRRRCPGRGRREERMTAGPHWSATAGEGGGGAGWRLLLGQLGRRCCVELGRGACCWAAARRGAGCGLLLQPGCYAG